MKFQSAFVLVVFLVGYSSAQRALPNVNGFLGGLSGNLNGILERLPNSPSLPSVPRFSNLKADNLVASGKPLELIQRRLNDLADALASDASSLMNEASQLPRALQNAASNIGQTMMRMADLLRKGTSSSIKEILSSLSQELANLVPDLTQMAREDMSIRNLMQNSIAALNDFIASLPSLLSPSALLESVGGLTGLISFLN